MRARSDVVFVKDMVYAAGKGKDGGCLLVIFADAFNGETAVMVPRKEWYPRGDGVGLNMAIRKYKKLFNGRRDN